MHLQIVWMALLLAIGSYVAIAYFVGASDHSATDPESLGPLEYVLAFMSLSCLAVSYFLPRKLLRAAVGQEDPETVPLEKLVAMAFAPWIVRMALTESIGIYGLLAAMLSHQPSKVLPFAIISALVMVTAVPSERALRSAAQSS